MWTVGTGPRDALPVPHKIPPCVSWDGVLLSLFTALNTHNIEITLLTILKSPIQ